MIQCYSAGRFDVLGGVADYSGSAVMLLPTSEMSCASLNVTNTGSILTSTAEKNDEWDDFEISLDELKKIDLNELSSYFSENRRISWAAHVIGVAKLFLDAGFEVPSCSIQINSNIPIGAGLASSAAVEVSVGKCFAKYLGTPWDELPKICQTAENRVALAPSGIMDHTVSTFGSQDHLFFMSCDPMTILDQIKIHEQIAVLGIFSGVKHSVAGRQYSEARCSSFIGKTILGIDGYLCSSNLSEAEIGRLPAEILGSSFLDTYGDHGDKVTKVENLVYKPRDAVKHAVQENARVLNILDSLRNNKKPDFSVMYDSHKGYSKIGLGSEQTDLLIDMLQRKDSVLGARISGGGCGGTVVVVCNKDWQDEIKEVLDLYYGITKIKPKLFR